MQPTEPVACDVSRWPQHDNQAWLALEQILPNRVPEVTLRGLHLGRGVIHQGPAGVQRIRVAGRKQPEVRKAGGEGDARVVHEGESARDVVG